MVSFESERKRTAPVFLQMKRKRKRRNQLRRELGREKPARTTVTNLTCPPCRLVWASGRGLERLSCLRGACGVCGHPPPSRGSSLPSTFSTRVPAVEWARFRQG